VRIKARPDEERSLLQALGLAARSRGALLLFWTVATVLGGGVLHRTGLLRQAFDLFSPRTVKLLVRRAEAHLSPPERLVIDIAHKDFMNLAHQRDLALQRQVLIVSDEDVVRATVRWRDKVIPVRLRLKGDLTDHLEGDKWSFRIIARQDSTVLGMKQFSLQHPQTRYYLFEKVYHEAMRREGITALRYDFVDVTVNGRDLGVYAVEEAFETRLIEFNQRKDGPIVRFNEDILWGELARQVSVPAQQRGAVAGAGSFQSSDIDAFASSKWLATEGGRETFLAAIGLLEGFRVGRLRVDEAFDAPLMARFFALTDLFRAWHGAGNWPNARFYYNPITSRLEPISFDGFNRGMPSRPGLLAMQAFDEGEAPEAREYIARFFADTAFQRLYLSELERVSDSAYVEQMIAELEPMMAPSLKVLHREFPEIELDWHEVRRSAEFIRVALHPPRAVQAYLRARAPGRLELEVANMQALPVRVVGIARDSASWPSETLVLPGKQGPTPLRFVPLTVAVPTDFVLPDTGDVPLLVRYQLVGSARVDGAPVFPWPHEGLGESRLRARPTLAAANARSFPFLTIDEAGGRIGIRPGSWRVDRTMIIPAGYRLVAAPGTRLDLVKGAAIVSRSPLDWQGTDDDPVIVESSDGSGQGVAVLQAGEPSVLRHVHFRGLANPEVAGWELTGAVSFYESPVEITRTTFQANRSEDALHVMRTRFSLDSVTFLDTSADAFDVDFGTGSVLRSRFINCGNDGVDASGSVLTLEDVEVQTAGDKGVSAGEVTTLEGRRLRIHGAAIGIAAKDKSVIRLADVQLDGGQVGITAYRKKSEYGPAEIRINGLNMRGQAVPYMIERFSSLTVDGRAVPADRFMVADSLYGAVYGKASVR
jgi:hypothetical protein